MATWICRIDPDGPGLAVGVKDLIDVAGVPTTAGARVVADAARPAVTDAACLVGLRFEVDAGRAHIVGKTNLHELAFGVTGINPWFGTPVNPVDAARVPGGSSSGAAVAAATGEVEVSIGTDTGGSVRIPAACCGISALKTTGGRIPTTGVWPLSPSLDTVGPMARDVAGLNRGLRLLDPTATDAVARSTWRVGRLRLPDVTAAIDVALDAALAAAGVTVVDVELPGWAAATTAGMTILNAEEWALNGALARGGGLGPDVETRTLAAAAVTPAQVAAARQQARHWRAELDAVLATVDAVALPTLRDWPPLLADAALTTGLRLTMPVNLAGVPALSLPVPADGPVPASLQLIGRRGGDEELLGLGAVVEAAVPRPGR